MPYADPEVRRQKTVERLRRLRSVPGYSAAKNAKWQAAHPEKRAAHKAVEKALRTGALERQPCECGCDRKPEAHHDDYSKPLEVRWLCRSAHRQHHQEHG